MEVEILSGGVRVVEANNLPLEPRTRSSHLHASPSPGNRSFRTLIYEFILLIS